MRRTGHRGAVTSMAAALAMGLVLVAAAPGRADDRLLGRRLKDAAITALVKARLMAARPVSVTSIHVDTDEGVVRLRGTVPGLDEWAEARRLAEETVGVHRVANELRIEPASARASD